MSFFFETPTSREELVSVALGEEQADLLIIGGTLVNVATSEMYKADIALKGDRIAVVGDVSHTRGDLSKIVDARGQYLLPGLIEAHFHIESAMVSPSEFARIVLPRGNTTVVVDPSWTANTSGIDGVKLLLAQSHNLGVRLLIDAPSCVPIPPHDLMTPGHEFGMHEIKEMLGCDQVVALGEMNDFDGVLSRANRVHSEIRAAMEMGKITNGNAPGLVGKRLQAYIAAGMQSDHEATTLEEGIERLRAGIRLVIRQSSGDKNLPPLIAAVTKEKLDPRHCCFCTDNKNILDLAKEGLIDNAVRVAISEGLDPMVAIQMATLNAAEHVGIDRELGSISPGKIADILLVKDLRQFAPSFVVASGKIVAKDEQLLLPIEKEQYPPWASATIRMRRKISPNDLKISTERKGRTRVWVIKVVEGQITSEATKEQLQVEEGYVLPDSEKDVLKAVAVERYGRTAPNIGKGFVTGFALRTGALATSICADAHHLTSIGTSDEDIWKALDTVTDLQGGIVAVEKGHVVAQLPLPIYGIISTQNSNQLIANLKAMNEAAKKLGCKLSSPFSTLSLVGNPSLPELRLSDMGLIHMSSRIIPLETD
jgi:adenine deaminase